MTLTRCVQGEPSGEHFLNVNVYWGLPGILVKCILSHGSAVGPEISDANMLASGDAAAAAPWTTF